MEPESITIESSELKMWLKTAEDGLNPLVVYRLGEQEKRRMAEEAYEERGKALYFIAQRLRWFLHP